jgi:hypothetical protein
MEMANQSTYLKNEFLPAGNSLSFGEGWGEAVKKFSLQLFILALLASLTACNNSKSDPAPTSPDPVTPAQPVRVEVPAFDADRAYAYIEQQVAFGPRVPGTPEHTRARQWMAEELEKYAGEGNVIVQEGQGRLYTGKVIPIYNIIAQFNRSATQRILLMAHYDTRQWADHDPDPARHNKPIDGANDGGSGVGALLEIARHLQASPLKNLGVDIILFDAEDQGTPDHLGLRRTQESVTTWCLGSQWWARNRHRTDVQYRWGILLDMVGAQDAVFPKEGYSRQYAPRLVEHVWRTARELGHGRYFIPQNGAPINDDHYYINTIAGIPSIDIIHYDPVTGQFGHSWHTHDDNMEIIDRATLHAVGETVLHVVYHEDAGVRAM